MDKACISCGTTHLINNAEVEDTGFENVYFCHRCVSHIEYNDKVLRKLIHEAFGGKNWVQL